MAWDVLAAQHGGEWLQTQQLPLRYALLRPAPPRGGGGGGGGGEAAAGGPSGCGCVELHLWEIWADDGASWPGLQALVQLTHEIHARLGISAREQEACPCHRHCPCPRTRTRTRTRVRAASRAAPPPPTHRHPIATPSPPHRHPIATPRPKVSTARLAHSEARAFRLLAQGATPTAAPTAAPAAAPAATPLPWPAVELARVANHVRRCHREGDPPRRAPPPRLWRGRVLWRGRGGCFGGEGQVLRY
jgi:hypothetical protein